MPAEGFGGGERTEPATPRKRQEAREKGTVARSQDLNTAALLLAAFLLVFFLAGHLLGELSAVTSKLLGSLGDGRVDLAATLSLGGAGLGYLLRLMLPVAATLVVVGLAVNIVQVGIKVTFQPLQPDLSRLSPLKGFQRIFSRRGLMRLIFGVLKLIIVGAVLAYGFYALVSLDRPNNLLVLLQLDIGGALYYSNRALFSLGAQAAAALLALALLDVAFQRWQHERDLMMTKQELREELKRMEGDPKLKARRRRIQQRLALQRMMLDVPRADVVITNPTHVACAIRYEASEMKAPRLLAKGKGHLAHRIRELAAANDVPIVEEPELARLIYEGAEAGEEIPARLYKPVAEVLAYVYRLRRGGRRRAG